MQEADGEESADGGSGEMVNEWIGEQIDGRTDKGRWMGADHVTGGWKKPRRGL